MARPKIVYPTPSALPRPKLPPNVVKSAARALQILEFFEDIKREATSVEIAASLEYPQSSTSSLLATLVTLGYLNFNRKTRYYFPSNRVAFLGHWIDPRIFADGALLRMMSVIHRRTGDSVVLATPNGIFAQYIHVIQAPGHERLHLTVCAMLPLAASTSGYTLLSGYTDAEVKKIVYRINAESKPGSKLIRIEELLEILREIRAQGYCFKTGITRPGGATLSKLLPGQPNSPPLAVSIGGLARSMLPRREQIAAILIEEVERYMASEFH
jgi:DNA-binding IclR family transcriptional regulator